MYFFSVQAEEVVGVEIIKYLFNVRTRNFCPFPPFPSFLFTMLSCFLPRWFVSIQRLLLSRLHRISEMNLRFANQRTSRKCEWTSTRFCQCFKFALTFKTENKNLCKLNKMSKKNFLFGFSLPISITEEKKIHNVFSFACLFNFIFTRVPSSLRFTSLPCRRIRQEIEFLIH